MRGLAEELHNAGQMVDTLTKIAPLKPSIKKTNLDFNILSNYRPVSNLSFLFKIRERTVASHLSNMLLNVVTTLK